MEKNGTAKRVVSSIICAGLLLSSLPATLPVRAQELAVQPVATKVSKKLSQKEINKKLKSIKKTIRLFQTANWVVPIVLGTIAIGVLLIAGGISIVTAKRLGLGKRLKKLKELRKGQSEEIAEAAESLSTAARMLETEKKVAEALVKGKAFKKRAPKILERLSKRLEVAVKFTVIKSKITDSKFFFEKVMPLEKTSKNLYNFITLLISTDPTRIANILSPDEIKKLANEAQKQGLLKRAVNFISDDNLNILTGRDWGKTLLKMTGTLKELGPLGEVSEPAAAVAKSLKMPPVSPIAAAIALVGFIVPGVFAIITAIGFFPATIWAAFAMAGELELMEKKLPGTLTKDQKRTIEQLKNMAKGPVARGIMQIFALKDAQKTAAETAMRKNSVLGSTIAAGKPKKARKIIAKYVKLKWMEQNAKTTVEQMAKEKIPPGLQKEYRKAVKSLQKKEQQVKDLEKKHPILSTDPEVKDALQAFRQKADNIIEALKKPVIEEEEKRPVTVPL